MGSASDVYENYILDAILGGGFTRPGTVYVALYTAMPDDTGGGTEASGGAYARAAVTNNATNWPNATSGLKHNGTEVSYPAATADWGIVIGFGIFDAATAGNLMFWGALSSPRTVSLGVVTRFPANSLLISAD